MGRINVGRVLIAGLVAGIVADLLGYVVDGVLLAPQWAEGMKALGLGEFTLSQFIWFNLPGLITGIAMIWVYAGIRPRLGAGPKTAIVAGVLAWVLGSLAPNLGLMWIAGLFSRGLTAMTTAGNLAEFVIGAIAGAALYKE